MLEQFRQGAPFDVLHCQNPPAAVAAKHLRNLNSLFFGKLSAEAFDRSRLPPEVELLLHPLFELRHQVAGADAARLRHIVLE